MKINHLPRLGIWEHKGNLGAFYTGNLFISVDDKGSLVIDQVSDNTEITYVATNWNRIIRSVARDNLTELKSFEELYRETIDAIEELMIEVENERCLRYNEETDEHEILWGEILVIDIYKALLELNVTDFEKPNAVSVKKSDAQLIISQFENADSIDLAQLNLSIQIHTKLIDSLIDNKPI